MTHQTLSGCRIIELGTMLAAPFAAHVLQQLGAEVIKIEPPNGDPTRSLVRGGPSGTLIAYSHGKKSICIDLTKEEGRATLHLLLKTADVLIHNLAPKAAQKLGVSAADCKRTNPDLIYCHIRGYAQGPQANDLASNPVAEAATGVMEANVINGRPSRLGPSYHDQFAGAYAVIQILDAMLSKSKNASNSSPFSALEVGLYETGLHIASRDLTGVQLKTQLLGKPEREPHGEFSMPGYGAYLTSDGRWLYLLILTDGHWRKFCEALSLPEANDASLFHLRDRKKSREKVEELVRRAIKQVPFEELEQRLKSAGVGCTEVLPLEEVLQAPQAKHPGKLNRVRYRELEFEVPRFPLLQENAVNETSPPELGEHTIDILSACGLNDAEVQALLASGAVQVSDVEQFRWAPLRK